MFRLLRTFSEICEENGLRYFVVGGTLIGAVRHRGFIPWDDDIDVSMPLDDFRKFTELARELPGSFALQSEETDPRYPFVFAKLCDTQYAYDTGYDNHPMGVYIDIFPLIPARALSRRTKLIFDMISVSDYVLQVKLGWTEFVPYKKPLARAGVPHDELSFCDASAEAPAEAHRRDIRRKEPEYAVFPGRGVLCGEGVFPRRVVCRGGKGGVRGRTVRCPAGLGRVSQKKLR